MVNSNKPLGVCKCGLCFKVKEVSILNSTLTVYVCQVFEQEPERIGTFTQLEVY